VKRSETKVRKIGVAKTKTKRKKKRRKKKKSQKNKMMDVKKVVKE